VGTWDAAPPKEHVPLLVPLRRDQRVHLLNKYEKLRQAKKKRTSKRKKRCDTRAAKAKGNKGHGCFMSVTNHERTSNPAVHERWSLVRRSDVADGSRVSRSPTCGCRATRVQNQGRLQVRKKEGAERKEGT